MRLSLPRLKMPRLPGFSILVWISTALKGWVMGSREKDTDSLIMYDRTLLWLTFGLAAIGFIMVTSASMPIGQRLTNDPFFFAKRDGVYLIPGIHSGDHYAASADGVLATLQCHDAARIYHPADDRAGSG